MPMTCATCTARTEEKLNFQEGRIHVVGLRCGHFNVIVDGAPVRLSSFASNAGTAETNAFEAVAVTSANLALAVQAAKKLGKH